MEQATNQNGFIQFIINERLTLMGLSIIAILLYHSYAWIVPQESSYLQFFKYGYIGVDIFMFLSGFGLCFSYTKNKLSTFYYRRLIRIFPLNIISGIIITLFILQHGDSITIWDIICNITTLYYYGLGGTYWNWFIPSIIILYILFPILFFLSEKFDLFFFITLNIALVLFLALFHIDWQYSCLISRLPVFVSGILAFFYKNKERKILELFLVNFLFFIICCSYNLSEYYLTTTFCPLLFITVHLFKKRIPSIPFIEVLGKNTLEIFLGNSISYYVLHIFIRHCTIFLLDLFLYFISTYIISYIFTCINRKVYRHLHFTF